MRIVKMLLIAGVVLVPASVFGQVSLIDSTQKEPSEEEKAVQIVLYPAAEPRPAMKYQLLPPFLERRPGNAAVWWNRLPAERAGFFRKFYDKWKDIEKWMEIPLGDPREKECRKEVLAKHVGMFDRGEIYSDMERAARFESCDWQQPIREGNYIAILLPEVQQMRTYGRLLEAKAHLEIAEGRYDEAVRTLQTGYAEARHVVQSPTLVSALVGVTIAGTMSNEVQQLIQQPDAPNLYWALSTLPRPLVDFRLGGEAESNLLYLQFPRLRDLDKKNLSPEEWRKLLNEVMEDIRTIWDTSVDPHMLPAVTTLLALRGYPLAKRTLIEQGRTAAEVEAMPVAQVVLLYTVQLYEELSDDQFKWFFLPAAEAGDGLQRAEQRMSRAFTAKREIIPLASILLPASASAKKAETRLEWKLAMLRIFEAMRLYAAAHDGQWPDHLSDITNVPVPVNPYDGKPFVYRREGDKAILNSETGPRGMPWRYEIKLMQKQK